MGLTAEDVVSALTVCCGEELDEPFEAVALVRQSQPSFAATLYSVWRAEGAELDPGLEYELRVAETRIDRFRSVAAELAQQVPGLMPIKGLEVAAAYPAGIVRTMNDLDYVAPAEPDLWRAVGHLVKDGWELHTATFTQTGDHLRIMVSLRHPFDSPYVLPYGIEIANYVTLGDMNGVPPLHRLPDGWRAPAVKNTVMLLFERFEQRYRARDLVDASLVLGSADPAELAVLAAAITRLGLEPEYAELARLVAATTLRPLPLPAGGRRHPVTRVRRLARSVGFLRHPLSGTARHLQRRVVTGDAHRYERAPWALAQRRLSVAAALRAGLLTFGLPLEAPAPPVEAAVVRTRGELTWVDTPVGRFLLTIGDDVTEEDVEELST